MDRQTDERFQHQKYLMKEKKKENCISIPIDSSSSSSFAAAFLKAETKEKN